MTPERLLEHAAWVRGLARAILHDEQLAEDVAQEAYLAAWQERPRRPKAWLGTVVRNLAASRLRGDGRRAARERKSARPEAGVPGTDDLVAKAELQRRVVQEVLALDEPYRTTLLLRFFEGRSAREIAERTGVTPVSVRSRVHRGVALLRTRMKGAGLLAALGTLAALPAPAAAATTGAVALKAAVVAAFLGVGVVVTQATVTPRAPRTTTVPRAEATAPAPPQTRGLVDGEATGPGDDEPGRGPGHLDVVVRSLAGAPLERAWVSYGTPEGGWFATLRTGADGRVRLPMDVIGWLKIGHREMMAGERRLDGVDPARHAGGALEVRLHPGCEVRGRVRTPGGGGVSGAVFLVRPGARALQAYADRDGAFRFVRVPPGSYVLRSSAGGPRYLQVDRPLEVRADTGGLELVAPPAQPVRVEITGADGDVLFEAGAGTAWRVVGFAEFGTLTYWIDPARTTHVRARAAGFRTATARVAPHVRLALEPAPAPRVELRCVGPHGRPLRRVEVRMLARTEKFEGAEAALTPPPGPLTLRVRAPGRDASWCEDPLVPRIVELHTAPGEVVRREVRFAVGGWAEIPKIDGAPFPRCGAYEFEELARGAYRVLLPPGRWRIEHGGRVFDATVTARATTRLD